MDDFSKYQVLTNHWKLNSAFKFPFSEHSKARSNKKERRYASQKHLESFKWLVFSVAEQGYFCKFCALFVVGQTAGFRKSTPLKKLVTQALTNFDSLTGKCGDLTVHEQYQYHRQAVEAAQDFVFSYENPQAEVSNMLSSARQQQVEENRKIISSVVETVLLCGRQNIALRGHRDDGDLMDTVNQGNFRALLLYRMNAGDVTLQKHLETSSRRNTYISKTIQNEIIDCCKDELQAIILGRVRKAGFYSIIFDETADASHISQLTLSFRYIDEDHEIREDLFSFTDVYAALEASRSDDSALKATGVAIAAEILKIMKSADLDVNNCVGIATDGCAVMTSQKCGAVQELQKTLVNAVHCWCFSDKLNLSISKSALLSCIRNASAQIRECISFFASSAKRNAVLLKRVGSQIPGLCDTRWVERHDSVACFNDELISITAALEEVTNWTDACTAPKAQRILSAILEPEFLVTVASLASVLEITQGLSRFLLKKVLTLSKLKIISRTQLRFLRNFDKTLKQNLRPSIAMFLRQLWNLELK